MLVTRIHRLEAQPYMSVSILSVNFSITCTCGQGITFLSHYVIGYCFGQSISLEYSSTESTFFELVVYVYICNVIGIQYWQYHTIQISCQSPLLIEYQYESLSTLNHLVIHSSFSNPFSSLLGKMIPYFRCTLDLQSSNSILPMSATSKKFSSNFRM